MSRARVGERQHRRVRAPADARDVCKSRRRLHTRTHVGLGLLDQLAFERGQWAPVGSSTLDRQRCDHHVILGLTPMEFGREHVVCVDGHRAEVRSSGLAERTKVGEGKRHVLPLHRSHREGCNASDSRCCALVATRRFCSSVHHSLRLSARSSWSCLALLCQYFVCGNKPRGSSRWLSIQSPRSSILPPMMSRSKYKFVQRVHAKSAAWWSRLPPADAFSKLAPYCLSRASLSCGGDDGYSRSATRRPKSALSEAIRKGACASGLPSVTKSVTFHWTPIARCSRHMAACLARARSIAVVPEAPAGSQELAASQSGGSGNVCFGWCRRCQK